MDDIPSSLANNPATVLGSLAAFAAAAAAIWRKYVRDNKVNDASAGSEVKQIERLQSLLDAADKRNTELFGLLEKERERSDIAFKERNDAMRELGQFQQKISDLTTQVERLTRESEELKNVIQTLKAGK